MNLPLIVLLLLIVIYFGTFYKIFERTNEDSWKGFIPFLNFVVWLKVIKRPWWWIFLLFVPGVNLIMLVVMNVETSKAFNLRTSKDQWLAGILPHWVFIELAYKNKGEYVGPYDWNGKKKSMGREWGEAIVFAVVAATIIRTLLMEAYTIPTPSMEKSLMVGDYLFVSKMSYGPKLPNTPVSFPFAHHTLPFTKSTRSYLEWFKLPYFRLPGFGDVERMDAVVFNFPEGDTVATSLQEVGYYQLCRDYGKKNVLANRMTNPRTGQKMFGDIVVRPVDKKENYIKRCVGIGGDVIEVREGQLFINDKMVDNPEQLQYDYHIKAKDRLNSKLLKDKYDITTEHVKFSQSAGEYIIPLSADKLEALSKNPVIDTIYRKISPKGAYNGINSSHPIFPNHKNYDWSEDNFGPLWIPKAGESIDLTLDNLPLYERSIRVYEGNQLYVKDNEIYINGAVTQSYTFKMDHYFMMGDNRHRSADSRFWGFVPVDHVVGKAVFIWFSTDAQTGIRWDRVFSTVK
jgi:signal peptidase I